MEVRGRCLMTWSAAHVYRKLGVRFSMRSRRSPRRSSRGGAWVLERTPPELTGDISANGITMTGGGSLIWGFDS